MKVDYNIPIPDKMTLEAEKAVNKIDVEKDDVEISIKDLLENELRERNVNKHKIEQVILHHTDYNIESIF